MTCGVYRITNTVTNDCYVGQSVNVERRWRSHVNGMKRAIYCRRAELSGNTNLLIQSLAVKHGLSSFEFEVLENCRPEMLSSKESDWVIQLKPSLNRAPIYVDPSTGRHPTNISRLKSRDTLPAIGSEDIERFRVAITDLSKDVFGVCTLSELIELKEDSHG